MEGINNSGWLTEDSVHSFNRAKERAGMSRKKAFKMMSLARERGMKSEDCRWSLDRNFLARRTNDETLALAFNGYCFIMDRITMNCITIYPLPKHFGKKKTFYKTQYQDCYEEMYEAV